jgi:hypothetical protein
MAPKVDYIADPLPFDEPDDWSSLVVGPVGTWEGSRFIARHHYAGGGGGSCTNVGLYRGMRLVGVAAFGGPVSGDAAASVFGQDYVSNVMDLQRFVLVEEAPKNTESWFLVRALREYKRLRPHTWAVTAFADSTQGHVGTIYQATNALYGGRSSLETQFRDGDGRLRSNRLRGKRVRVSDALARGWTPERRDAKHRYLVLTPDDRAHGRRLRRMVRWEQQPYPRAGAVHRSRSDPSGRA